MFTDTARDISSGEVRVIEHDLSAGLVSAALDCHMPVFEYEKRRYNAAANEYDRKLYASLLITPADSDGMKETTRKMTQGQTKHNEWEKVVGAHLALDTLPAAVAEMCRRAELMVKIWEYALASANKDIRSLRGISPDEITVLYEQFGIDTYLEALAAGVPIEDLFA